MKQIEGVKEKNGGSFIHPRGKIHMERTCQTLEVINAWDLLAPLYVVLSCSKYIHIYKYIFKIHSQDSYCFSLCLPVCLIASKIPQNVRSGFKQTFLQILMIEQATDDYIWWCSRFQRGLELWSSVEQDHRMQPTMLCTLVVHVSTVHSLYVRSTYNTGSFIPGISKWFHVGPCGCFFFFNQAIAH